MPPQFCAESTRIFPTHALNPLLLHPELIYKSIKEWEANFDLFHPVYFLSINQFGSALTLKWCIQFLNRFLDQSISHVPLIPNFTCVLLFVLFDVYWYLVCVVCFILYIDTLFNVSFSSFIPSKRTMQLNYNCKIRWDWSNNFC